MLLLVLPPLPTRMSLGNDSRTGMNGSRGTAHHRAIIYPRRPLLPHGPQRGRHPPRHPRATPAPPCFSPFLHWRCRQRQKRQLNPTPTTQATVPPTIVATRAVGNSLMLN
jgi:hypothetical protein